MSVSVATTVMQSMRLPFLLLTPSVLLLAFALAEYTGSSLYWLDMALIMVAGISAHMSVNLLNEHSDFCTGLDMQTERTPFSGGSGGLPANPEAASAVYKAGIATLVLTVGIGFYYVLIFGYQLLLLGTLGALLVVAYGAWKHQANIARLMPFMAMNVLSNLLTPALLAVLMFVH